MYLSDYEWKKTVSFNKADWSYYIKRWLRTINNDPAPDVIDLSKVSFISLVNDYRLYDAYQARSVAFMLDFYKLIKAPISKINLSFENLWFFVNPNHITKLFSGIPSCISTLSITNSPMFFKKLAKGYMDSYYYFSLLQNIPATVTYLDFSNNNFSQLTVNAFMNLLKSIPSGVRTINLSGNGLDELSLSQQCTLFNLLPIHVTEIQFSADKIRYRYETLLTRKVIQNAHINTHIKELKDKYSAIKDKFIHTGEAYEVFLKNNKYYHGLMTEKAFKNKYAALEQRLELYENACFALSALIDTIKTEIKKLLIPCPTFNAITLFRQECLHAIFLANQVLKRHRGFKKNINLIACAKNENCDLDANSSFFFFKTDSANKIQHLAEDIKKMKV